MGKILKSLKIIFLLSAMILMIIGFTGAFFSDSVSSTNFLSAASWSVTPTATASPSPSPEPSASVSPESEETSGIILNEVMVNPENETGVMPDGEWVELFNKSSENVDVDGWQVRDSGSQFFTITSSKTNTGSTIIAPGGYLAVYRNMGSSMFNNDGDSVKIYDDSTIIDSFDYVSSTDKKSWARLPDGTGGWSDGHTPNPGGTNE